MKITTSLIKLSKNIVLNYNEIQNAESNFLKTENSTQNIFVTQPLTQRAHSQPKLNTISSREHVFLKATRPIDHHSCASLGYGRTPSHITLNIKLKDLPNLGDLHQMALSAQTTSNTNREGQLPKQTSN